MTRGDGRGQERTIRLHMAPSLGTLDDSTMSKKEQGYSQPEYAKMTARITQLRRCALTGSQGVARQGPRYQRHSNHDKRRPPAVDRLRAQTKLHVALVTWGFASQLKEILIDGPGN
jgi:hypothetical protein